MDLYITGDLALARGIDKKVSEGAFDFFDPALFKVFSNPDDFHLINLECPVTDSTEPQWAHFPTMKASTRAFEFVKQLHVDVASLANNHISDYGTRGLWDTVNILEKHGIRWVGAGKTQEEASAPLIVSKNECTFGFLALAQKEISAAGKKSPGAAVLKAKHAVKSMAELAGKVDIAIAYLHFGPEFFEYPTPDQVELSRALIDAGAHMVIGHHPHVVQGYEFYKNKLIAYSLGNFVFDMKPVLGSSQRLGMMIQASIVDKAIDKVTIHYVETSRGRTVLLDSKSREDAKNHVDRLSAVLADRNLLIERYYFTCRDHLMTYLSALINFLVKKRNLRNCYDWVVQLFWPQIFKMRVDLVKFIISGKALAYEVKKGPPQEGIFAYAWRGVCYVGAAMKFVGGFLFTVK